jgi:hypothetical protein
MMLAAGMLLVSVLLAGNTISVLGATPKLHCSVAPAQTCIPISTSSMSSGFDIVLKLPWLIYHRKWESADLGLHQGWN